MKLARTHYLLKMNQRQEIHTVYEKNCAAIKFLFYRGLQDTPDIWKGWAVDDTSEESHKGLSSQLKHEKWINLCSIFSVVYIMLHSLK